ncbi:hypothetical protein D3C80_1770530 [compost metagenome]
MYQIHELSKAFFTLGIYLKRKVIGFGSRQNRAVNVFVDVVPKMFKVDVAQHPSDGRFVTALGTVEEQHCKEATKLMLSQVVSLAVTKIRFEIVTKEVEISQIYTDSTGQHSSCR